MHTSTSGGVSDTDENAVAVMPTGSSPSPCAATTVTPLTNRASASRNACCETESTMAFVSVAFARCRAPALRGGAS